MKTERDTTPLKICLTLREPVRSLKSLFAVMPIIPKVGATLLEGPDGNAATSNYNVII